MIDSPKMHHIRDVWKVYAFNLLTAHTDWWGRYHNKTDNYYIYRKINTDRGISIEEVFSYAKFKQIIDEFFISAKVSVIEGEAINLRIGKVCARRAERDHSNKQVNWGKTRLQDKVVSEKTGKLIPKKMIYHTEDDYCRIGFHKVGKVRNETLYEFKPADNNSMGTGFKQEFTKALRQNILLKYRYLYFPLHKVRKPAPEGKEVVMYQRGTSKKSKAQ